MKLLASKALDEFTFNRCREIAQPFGIDIQRGDTKKDLFVYAGQQPPADRDEQLKLFLALDNLTTCARSIQRLANTATI